jgi:S1-C subfamily serine protease
MSVQAVCPLCGASYHLADGYQGQRVHCRDCRKPFWVAGTAVAGDEGVIEAELAEHVITASLARPAAGGAERVAPPRRPRRQSTLLLPILLIAGGAAALLLVVGFTVLAVVLTRGVASPESAGGAPDLAAEAPPGGTDLPPRVLRDVKNATVFVKVDAGDVGGSGSGFVIKVKRDGPTAYVVTNHHVIAPELDDADEPGPRRGRFPLRPPFARRLAQPTITLVFWSGTPRERSAPASIVLDDAERDLALLQVTGVQDLPAPIPLVRNPGVGETMPVFLFGFPFGDALALHQGNPAITVGKGSVSSLRLNDRGEVARIQIDGDLNPGNSGGPVVDAKGRLVGIAVAKVRNTRIGLAIPPADLIAMLEAAARR